MTLYLTYYVRLVGTERNMWLQEWMELEASQYGSPPLYHFLPLKYGFSLQHPFFPVTPQSMFYTRASYPKLKSGNLYRTLLRHASTDCLALNSFKSFTDEERTVNPSHSPTWWIPSKITRPHCGIPVTSERRYTFKCNHGHHTRRVCWSWRQRRPVSWRPFK